MIDSTNQLLLNTLQNTLQPTLWLADESSAAIVAHVPPSTHLQIITNRFDIYQKGLKYQHNIVFSDFDISQLKASPDIIVYRISKEKPLVHFLLNQANQLLLDNQGNQLIQKKALFLIGQKNEGIKNYHHKLLKNMNFDGVLKKQKNDYIGEYTASATKSHLEDNNYQQLRKINTKLANPEYFYSKPGLFGWQKIDHGSQLLLATLTDLHKHQAITAHTVLDLGCGYGWITINTAALFRNDSTTITATDNNAAALLCCEANIKALTINAKVIAADCANTITEKFDLILCNPPFHQGFAHDQSLISKFLHSTQQHLKAKGMAIFVVNEFISIEKQASDLFQDISILKKKEGFKVVKLCKEKH